MTTTAPLLTELAEELASDHSGQKRKEVLEKIESYQAEVQQLLRNGVPGGQFARVESLGKALDSAKEIAEKLVFPN